MKDIIWFTQTLTILRENETSLIGAYTVYA